MTSKYFQILLLCIALGVAGCNKVLDKAPLNIISDKVVFADTALTQAYLYDIYDYMPVGYGLHYSKGTMILSGLGITDLLDGSTDLLRSPAGWNESNSMMIPGLFSPTYNPLENWGRCYTAIRKTNNLLYNLPASTQREGWKQRIMAEARFIRAFMYFDLVRRYNDVPLITTLQPYDKPDSFLVPRTPASQVYDFIDRELSAIADQLPAAANLLSSESGRITREAAWALNGRAMLFAKRYDKAAAYSQKVISSGAFVLNPDYNALFQSRGGDREVIFEVMFDGINKGHAFDNLFLPPSIDAGWGSQTLPTQEIVDAYEMINGRSIADPTSGYDPQNPYANRDKRFYASIVYDSSVLKGKLIRTAWHAPIDGLDIAGGTITGYYIRKFIDEALPYSDLAFGKSRTSWKELRLGEVLLNYAEAQNELNGPDASVYDAVNQVRTRAGLPGLPSGLSKAGMFSHIVHEREVELAFEGHRFWDLRRWGLAADSLNNRFMHGMQITTDASGKRVYKVFRVDNTTADDGMAFGVPLQVFLPKHYLMPIPQGELNRNPKLTQNPGY